ncbi:ASB_HP2_G0006800.mRNA.1.CDS.1 [Saccharomyces cerevisiae]|nr:ASB_HP2_G0006800.mRNA.1.CDS.1 [Saccharomyces cerevisiae]CAI6413093.1 ASB_HP1_G0006640.mRNA.1.CDS.1 [Saccharomyces cerevisiae]CAI6414345.1 ASB_HP2_G0006800.mRNA.1.CDS.1 [Saccharomyces cerevisiae]CAI6606707.1 ASB_HP1_G0031220.mRNA.1.CDS.1 [Saccharomyces cerevisiae]CAI7196286.1 ASB_collapsed_G0031820.mRNA.1.CDS.1 [Saccharomyces cerevisiae]
MTIVQSDASVNICVMDISIQCISYHTSLSKDRCSFEIGYLEYFYYISITNITILNLKVEYPKILEIHTITSQLLPKYSPPWFDIIKAPYGNKIPEIVMLF